MPHSEAQASTPLSLGMKLNVLASNHPNNIGQLSQPSCYFWWLTQVIQPEIPIWLTTPQKENRNIAIGYRHYRDAIWPQTHPNLHIFICENPLKIHWKSLKSQGVRSAESSKARIEFLSVPGHVRQIFQGHHLWISKVWSTLHMGFSYTLWLCQT